MPNSRVMINTFAVPPSYGISFRHCHHHGLQFEFIWELFGFFQELFWLFRELFELFWELCEVFWEFFRLFWEMFGSRDSVHRSKNASIFFLALKSIVWRKRGQGHGYLAALVVDLFVSSAE